MSRIFAHTLIAHTAETEYSCEPHYGSNEVRIAILLILLKPELTPFKEKWRCLFGEINNQPSPIAKSPVDTNFSSMPMKLVVTATGSVSYLGSPLLLFTDSL